MDDFLGILAVNSAMAIEILVVVAVCIGASETVFCVARQLIRGRHPGDRAGIWMSFARWLILALEFALGADIIRTAIAPSWEQAGQLAVIAAIRTGLGYFLELDIESERKRQLPGPQG